ncbi:MAG: thioredoxin family protein [Candidatus Marinimicrobia bacterium]|nr:thioredoxin family protein [Candidatus Neomarinimicrobiota bacterium]
MCQRGLSTIVLLFGFIVSACSNETVEIKLTRQSIDPIITFIELGSVRCIPCKKMQPVMASVENKYGGQVEVVFYDVWEADQKAYATQYGIKLIPTQIFLDSAGSELMRHEGYFPESEIDSLLVSYGLTVKAFLDK